MCRFSPSPRRRFSPRRRATMSLIFSSPDDACRRHIAALFAAAFALLPPASRFAAEPRQTPPPPPRPRCRFRMPPLFKAAAFARATIGISLRARLRPLRWLLAFSRRFASWLRRCFSAIAGQRLASNRRSRQFHIEKSYGFRRRYSRRGHAILNILPVNSQICRRHYFAGFAWAWLLPTLIFATSGWSLL